MRVLLTGSGGYVGAVAHTCSRRPVTTSSASTRRCTRVATSAQRRRPPDIRMDVRDVREEDMEGFDAVVHLAALSNDPIGELDEGLTYAVNHEATVRLAELARSRGVERFVFASSCSMYGASGTGLPVDETRPARANHRVRRVEGAQRAIAGGARERRLLAGVASVRDRLWCLAAPPPGHRPQQPRRVGFDDGRGASPE